MDIKNMDLKKGMKIAKSTQKLASNLKKDNKENEKADETGLKEESSGRKAESKFITALISRIGNEKINSDYTGYIELDDFACWIIADGIIASEGSQEASQKVVEKIIEKFIEKPKFSKGYLRNLLQEAHIEIKRLQENKRLRTGIGTSLTILLSDYSSIIFGNIGETRGIFFRDEYISFKTKDDSIAYLLYEAGQLQYDAIRFNNEKDKLTQYLGSYGNIKPTISNKIKLVEGDKILLLSSGAWNNMDESHTEIALSQSNRVGNWVGKLENIIQDSKRKKLDNYSIIGIFIDKVAIQKKNYREYFSKYLFLIPIFVILGYFIYLGYSIKSERDSVYREIYSYEEKALKEVKAREYEKALENYTKSKNKYNELYLSKQSGVLKNKLFSSDILNRNIDNQIESLDIKISDLKLVEKLDNLNQEAKLAFKRNEFIKTKELYENMQEIIKALQTNDFINKTEWNDRLKEQLEEIEILIVGNNLKNTADSLLQEKDIEGAIRNYLEAKIIFLKYNKVDLLTEVTNKVELLTKQRDDRYKKALELEKNALKVESTDITSSIAYYELAKNIYEKMNDEAKVNEISEKLTYLIGAKEMIRDERESYLKDARVYTKEGNFDKALETVKKAQENSNILKDYQGLADSLDNEGDIFVEKKNYILAKEKYNEAYKNIIKTPNTLHKKQLEDKQNMMNILIKTQKLEAEGDKLFKNKKYKDAKFKFKDAMQELKRAEVYPQYKELYTQLMNEIAKKEKKAWRESNWIPFF